MARMQAVAFLAAVFSASAAQADPVTITPLDWLSGGEQYATIVGISGDGSTVAGNAKNATDETHASSWDSATGAITDLGISGESFAYAISFDGSTIVGYQYSNPANFAFAAQGGTVTYLPTASVNQNVAAYGVNSDGSVIVGEGNFGSDYHAMMWSGANWATITDLGVLPTGTTSFATGVSGDGSVVVGGADVSNMMGSFNKGFYWTAGAMHALPSAGEDGYSTRALAISNDGTTIVGYSDASNGERAVKWTGTNYATLTDLGSLGGDNGQALAVNADGSVVVGKSTLSGNSTYHAFLYRGGGMFDLNALLASAGVNMTGITLDEATAVSGDASYVGANDVASRISYVIHYTSGIAGLTTASDQQDAANGLAETQQGALIQIQEFAAQLLGANDPIGAEPSVGAFGAVGSWSGGIAGKAGLGQGWALLGGISYAKEDFKNADMKRGVIAAAALRYVAGDGKVHPFAEAGGWVAPDASFTFKRPYANGAGAAVGVGEAEADMAYGYVKGGVGFDVTDADAAVLAAELGYSRLRSDGYAEPLTATNPFNAAVSSGTDKLAIAKIEGKWTHVFSPKIDVTLRLAGAHGFAASSDLTATVAGFGTFEARDPKAASWAEYGLRGGYRLSDSLKLDVFANGLAGQGSIHSEAHVGAELTFKL
jgi:probable HAF family extracellular repeat protein